MRYKLGLIWLMLAAIAPVMAETRIDRMVMPNEIRIGWGDMLFESLMWHNPTSVPQTMPEEWSNVYDEDFRHHQHLFLEYQYRVNYWLGVGLMTDLGEVDWNRVIRNGRGEEISREPGHYFYNISVMPTVRFTYLRTEYANFYSGLGIGLCVNGGTEYNSAGKTTDFGAAVNLTLLGLSVNYKRWFAAVEVGGLYGLKNANTVFMAGSRTFNASIGARF